MTDHHTSVALTPAARQIRYSDATTLLGSCFTEHIGEKLSRFKYDLLTNPFGILYNPVSLARSLERIVSSEHYTPDELVHHEGLYHSMDHHGMYSGRQPAQVADQINSSLDQAHAHLKKSKFIFVSPGTAFVYRYKPTGEIAGNCHKIPAIQFDYTLLGLEACIEAFDRIHRAIRTLAPESGIIWTVSPVRHLRDGLVENQRSKATLILATDAMRKRYPECGYFPAYEIMMDELRDYRYYARDMVHPSDLAIDYIWNAFAEVYLEPSTRIHHAAIEKIHRAMEHRFLHDHAQARRLFARQQLEKIDLLMAALPVLNWQRERQHFFQMTELD